MGRSLVKVLVFVHEMRIGRYLVKVYVTVKPL